MNLHTRLSPGTLWVLTITIVHFTLTLLPVPLASPLFAFAFYSTCPGTVLVDLLDDELSFVVGTAISVSIAMNVLIVTALLAGGFYSTINGVAAISAVSITAVLGTIASQDLGQVSIRGGVS